MDIFALLPYSGEETRRALARCNEKTAAWGLVLSEEEMAQLAGSRREALAQAGRVELGEGILPQLALTFAPSPYLHQIDYAGTLEELQELFYQFKTLCREQLSDEELLETMRQIYDEAAGGSVDFLAGLDEETLLSVARTGSLADLRGGEEENDEEE